MKVIIVNIPSGKNIRESKNELIAMLEVLLSQADTAEKKRRLAGRYGMAMTAELEGRIQLMCNLSENIEAEGIRKGIKEGIEQGIHKERIDAVVRMLRARAAKEQILSFGYTEDEYAQAEGYLSSQPG